MTCKQAKDSTGQVIVRLPNKWQWYESLCISWIKSSIDSSVWQTLDFDDKAGYVIVEAVFHPPYVVFNQIFDNNVYWEITTKFDNDVIGKKGLYKCLKYIYGPNRLNKTNLLRLPLPFVFHLSTAPKNGNTGLYYMQWGNINRDEHKRWEDYNHKHILLSVFDKDIRYGAGVPVKSLNEPDKLVSSINKPK
ncbi:MAG: hypothetical protein CSA40_00700 [Flavobacteriales bacterium]|nr:MAG: hypothetical protein CSA40_00700 [Flavobacteriales bacterium]